MEDTKGLSFCQNCGDQIRWVYLENRKTRFPINTQGFPYVVKSSKTHKYYLYFGYQPHYLTCPARGELAREKLEYEGRMRNEPGTEGAR